MSVMDAAFGEMFSGSRAATGFGLLMIVGGVGVFLLYGAERSVLRIFRRVRPRRQRPTPVRVDVVPAPTQRQYETHLPPMVWGTPVEPVTVLIPRYTDEPDATAVLPRIYGQVGRR
ncbi:hypothetical protein AB0B94_30390 [Micromonospora sp. NPDC048986]|uniref:hypothetical protein n=1 Tax=Micromonospora sp. NPDC048986 TaxID=3155644 RepID=UPI0033DDD9B0